MTSLDFVAAQRPSGKVVAPIAIAFRIARVHAAVSRYFSNLAAERQLSRLDERMLKDIGLSAGALPFVVRASQPLTLSPGSDR